MNEEKKIFRMDSYVSDYEIINPEFAKVKVYVCYAGKNRNMSEISQDVLDKISKTIYGVPIVAEYDKENNTFKGHGGKLEITEDEFKFVDTTVPYGFVDPTTPVFYEEVTELDGMTKNNYLCCYAYLWYKRYPEVESVLRNQENKPIAQSMEIIPTDYTYREDGYFEFKDGYFTALCMLGVEPCFESAKVTSKFSNEDFKNSYEEMFGAFKKYTIDNFAEGGDDVKNDEVVEVESTEIIDEVVETDVEEISEVVVEESTESTEEIADVETDAEEVVDYQVIISDLREEIKQLKSDYDKLNEEVKILRDFKVSKDNELRIEEENRVFEQYDEDLINCGGYVELKKDRSKYTIKELEERCLILYGKMMKEKRQSKKAFSKKETNSLLHDKNTNNHIANEEWAFMDKYLKK